jgi:SAM-dependent methyltransferase
MTTGSTDPASDEASPLEPHNARFAAMWSAGGAAYDEISRAVSEAIEHCVRRLDPKPGERVLDVATGTGWTSRRVAEAGARVTGVDIAADLLDAAQAKARQFGLDIEYRLGDAERLPFADASFDGVISTIGVMFASRPEAAAAELARVCRPGGRLALATWLPDSTVAEMFALMRPFMPAPPPGTQPPPSPFAWGDKGRLAELLGAGFELRFEQGVAHHRMPSGQAMWELFSTGYGPTKTLAGSLDAGRRAEMQEAFTAFHDRHRTELGITTPRAYLITVGTRR